VALALPQAGWGMVRRGRSHGVDRDRRAPREGLGNDRGFFDIAASGIVQTTARAGNEPDTATRQLTLDNGATIDESSTI